MSETSTRDPLAYFWGAVGLLMGLVLLTVPSGPAWAQEEVTSKIYRYRERVATGYYEGYEVSPRRTRAILEAPGIKRGLFPYGSSSANVRIRTRLPDSHRGLKFYYRNTCIECHPQEARNLHSSRAGITCRQCHGPEPIAAINHFYSAMNPIRRHAYICAKCHEGANAAFAGFYVHEPPAASLETRKSFPILFYVYWGMLLLLAGTLAFFIPHSLMVGLRELSDKPVFHIPFNLMLGLREAAKKRAFSIFHSLMVGLRKLFVKKKAREAEERLPHYPLWVRTVAGLIRLAVRILSPPIVLTRKILSILKRDSRSYSGTPDRSVTPKSENDDVG
jgi:hypothetical protein